MKKLQRRTKKIKTVGHKRSSSMSSHSQIYLGRMQSKNSTSSYLMHLNILIRKRRKMK